MDTLFLYSDVAMNCLEKKWITFLLQTNVQILSNGESAKWSVFSFFTYIYIHLRWCYYLIYLHFQYLKRQIRFAINKNITINLYWNKSVRFSVIFRYFKCPSVHLQSVGIAITGGQFFSYCFHCESISF